MSGGNNVPRICLSASIPDGIDPAARERIERFLRSFALNVFRRREWRLIHGSQPEVTEILVEVAKELNEAPGHRAGLALVASRYFSRVNGGSATPVPDGELCCAEPVIETPRVERDSEVESLRASLALMREALLEQSNVFVALGGRWWETLGGAAGVPEEIDLAQKAELPCFLLGELGGATAGHLTKNPELLRKCRNGWTDERNQQFNSGVEPEELAKKIVEQIERLPVRYRDPAHGRPFRILCLDGGGIRGVFTAAALEYWEKQSGLKVVDHFDLIAGTSTGGLLGIGLGLGLSAREMRTFYQEHGPEIFGADKSKWKFWHSFRHWFAPKFDADKLRVSVSKVYREAIEKLGVKDGGPLLRHAKTRLLIPAYSETADEPILFRTPHGPYRSVSVDRPADDAAVASASAPTYFHAAKVSEGGATLHAIDGGVWANSPTIIAIAEAVRELGIPIERVRLLNVGTTSDTTQSSQPLQVTGKTVGTGLGALGGLAYGLFGKLAGSSLGRAWKTIDVRGKLGYAQNIAGLLLKAQGQASGLACSKLLGSDRYMVVDKVARKIQLDDVSAMAGLIQMGRAAAESNTKKVTELFLNGVPAITWPEREMHLKSNEKNP